MTAVLFWEWTQGTDHVRPLSRVVATIIDAVNKDRDRIKGVALKLTEVNIHDAFEEALEKPAPWFEYATSLNDGYVLVVQKHLDDFYGMMRVERPWGKTTRILGEGWWFSLEVSV